MAKESCPRCVLLIEDDEGLRESIAAFLEECGYATVVAEDAERAVGLLCQTDLARPCLVLADFITLRIEWTALMNALERDDQLATLPMALVAVKTSGRATERVKKPIDFDLLDRIVKEHCCGGDAEGERPPGGRDSIGSGPG